MVCVIKNMNMILLIYTGMSLLSQNKDISIIKYLDENADLIKVWEYNKFIHQLSKKKINGVNVSNYFNLNKGYNLWWMSLVVEKSIYKSKSPILVV